MDDLPTELQPYIADLLLAKRWFEHARECRRRGQIQAAEYCCTHGEEVIARLDAWIQRDRASVASLLRQEVEA